MADFSINATQLSAPQGAGSSPVSAAPSALAGIVETIGGAVNIFAKGIERDNKAKAEEAKNIVLRQYSKELESINFGLRSGQLSPATARSYQRAAASRTMGAYGDMAPDIEKVTKAFTGTTELSDAEAQLDAETQGRNELIKKAQAAGFEIGRGEPETLVNAKLKAYQSSVRTDEDIRRLYQRQEEERKTTRYNQEQHDRERKELATEKLGTLARDQMDVLFIESKTLSDSIGIKFTPEEAKAAWGRSMAKVYNAINEAAKSNPELASSHRSMFERIDKLGQEMMDPVKRSESLKAMTEAIVEQAKLAALQKEPKLVRLVAASELMKNHASLFLGASSQASKIVLDMIKDSPEESTAPQLVGTPEEKTVFKSLETLLDSANSGKFEDNEKAAKEIANLSSHILEQVGQAPNKRNYDPATMAPAMNLFASQRFGLFMEKNKGKLDPKSVTLGYKTIQSYQEAVDRAVAKTVNQVFTKTTGLAPNRMALKDVDLKLEEQAVDYKAITPVFNTTGITFKLAKPSSNPVERDAQQRMLRELAPVEEAINRSIHANTHLEGDRNYSRFWEANKHTMLPMFFSAPEEGKSGEKASTKASYANEPAMGGEVSAVVAKAAMDKRDPEVRKEYAKAIREALKRTDLSKEARTELENDLKTWGK